MATVNFHYDSEKEEAVITFRIPDKEVQSANIPTLSRLAIKMNSTEGTLSSIALTLLIILEAIETTKETERKDAARQN